MSIPKPADWQRWCDDMYRSLDTLAKAGPEMIELARMPTTASDGFSGGGLTERVQGSAELTPTEAAADRRGFAGKGEDEDRVPPDQADWVAKNLGALFTNMREAKKALTRAHLAAKLVECRGDRRVGRQVTGGYCQACERYVTGAVGDRLVSGYCTTEPDCYDAWRRYMKTENDQGREASPVLFQDRRREKLGLARRTYKPGPARASA